MHSARSKELVLISGFLAILAAPGLIQTVAELRRGEPIQAAAVLRQWPTAKRLREYERDLEEASLVAKELRPWMQYAQFRGLHEAGDKALVGRDGWLFYKPGVRYLIERPRPPSPNALLPNPRAAIVDFRDQLAKRGIRLLVMIAPNKESIYPQQLSRRAVAGPQPLAVQTRQLLNELQAAGVEVVDLFQIFHAAQATPAADSAEPLYLAQDSHWSPAGVQIAAQAMAHRILDAGWAQRGSTAYAVKPIPVRRLGDIVQMLQVPQIKETLAPEDLVCRQILRQDDGQPYRDDPNAEILILGDSFLRIYQQEEPQSAGFIAQLAYELRRPLATLVKDGGAATLVRQELHRRPGLLRHTRLVIWEFVERDIPSGTEGWQLVPLPPLEAFE